MPFAGKRMLIEFRVKNFKSFRDEQTLSMVASADKTLSGNTAETQSFGKKLLRSSVLYGANASGKSNVIAALGFVQEFVRGSAERRPGSSIPVQPFRLDKTTIKLPSEFEVFFLHENIRYQYGFAVDQHRVHREWLIAYPEGLPQTWFERRLVSESGKGEEQWKFGSRLKGEKKRLQGLTRPDVLFLSLAATLNHKQLSEVYAWFHYYLRVVHPKLVGFDFMLERFIADHIKDNPAFQTRLTHLLGMADLGIVDFRLEEEEKEISENDLANLPESVRASILAGEDKYVAKQIERQFEMMHASKDPAEPAVAFPIEDESLGTRRLFALGGAGLHSLQEGFVLVVDELDDSLHPLLVQTLVHMFHDPAINRNNAQLIFNTHDTSLLSADLFRRDQIWFLEKDNAGASHLYTLLEFSPRKDEALEKGYLQGRYGAIPIIGDLDFIKDKAGYVAENQA